MVKTIVDCIGNTPLVRLGNVVSVQSVELFAKIEGANPSGSLKDRAALSMIKGAIDQGQIRSGTTVVESSSGNLAISLAFLSKPFGYHFICVTDPKITRENLAILHCYGAEVHVVDKRDKNNDYLLNRIKHVKDICASRSNCYWPNQYKNPYNAKGQERIMEEVCEVFGRNIDAVLCPVSSCGTIMGCAQYLRRTKIKTKMIAVDAIGSVIFGQAPGKRLVPGHGASRTPEILDNGLIDDVIHIGDVDCIVGCWLLVNKEGILTGGSSGAAVMAAIKLLSSFPKPSKIVLIFPDRGDRYTSTIYSTKWVDDNFPDLMDKIHGYNHNI